MVLQSIFFSICILEMYLIVDAFFISIFIMKITDGIEFESSLVTIIE